MATLYWPFSRSLVSEWPGTRPVGWADHVGTDFAIPQGTPLRATMSGTVDIIWNDGLNAWVIDIIAPDGTVARHGHLSYMAPNDGAWVNAGDYIGNTGGAIGTPGAGLSTGAHLHWEIRNNQGWGNYGWYDPRNLSILPMPETGGTGARPNGGAPAQGDEDMTPAERKMLTEVHAALWQITDPKNGLIAKLPGQVLDAKVPMEGSKKGQTKTLRQLIAWNDHQWASIKRPLEWLTKVGPKIAAKLGVK